MNTYKPSLIDERINMPRNTKVSINNHIKKEGIIKGVFKYGAWVQVGFSRTHEYCIFIKWEDLEPFVEEKPVLSFLGV